MATHPLMVLSAAMEASDEHILYPLVADYLSRNGFKVSTEVIYRGRKPYEIDIVGVRDGQVLSVEVKLRCFRKALQQAMKRLRHSDYVYLGFPMRYASFVIGEYRKAINKFGFGIIAIDEERAYELLPPRHSKQLNASLKRRFMMDIRRQARAAPSLPAGPRET